MPSCRGNRSALRRLILVEDGTPVCFERGEVTSARVSRQEESSWTAKGGDIGDVVLRDRRGFQGTGWSWFFSSREQTGDIIYGPETVSRGFVFEDHSGFILEEAKGLVSRS